ncbi:MAG: ABC transporter permease [Candidatus Methylacidiphilales bacterium]|nr:ABC transporter permease [Candidatus Methylacidiphilales bacterium]
MKAKSKSSLMVSPRLLGIIAARDFWAIVETKSFLIGLLAFIFIASVMPAMMILSRVPSNYRIAVLDPTGTYATELREEIRNYLEPGQMEFFDFRPKPIDTSSDPDKSGPKLTASGLPIAPIVPHVGKNLNETAVQQHPGGAAPEATADELLARVRDHEFYALVEIKATAAGEETFTMNSVSIADITPREVLRTCLGSIVREHRAQALGISKDKLAALLRGVRMETRKITPESTEKADSEKDFAIAFLFPIALVFSLYGLISFQSERLLTALLEEKMKRLIEVLLTRVTIYELILGKMLGILYVGILIYLGVSLIVIAGAYLFGVSYLLNPKHFFFYTLFYISGYMLYACFYAAIGAACGNPKDAENLSMPLRMLLMLPITISVYVVSHPQSAGSVFFAYFPMTAPFVMTNRMLATETPWYELTAAFLCVLTAACIGLWAAARVFAASLLNPDRSLGRKEIWLSLTGKAPV